MPSGSFYLRQRGLVLPCCCPQGHFLLTSRIEWYEVSLWLEGRELAVIGEDGSVAHSGLPKHARRMYKLCATNVQTVRDKCTSCQNMHDECTNGSNPRTTHSNDQSDECASNMNMHDDETPNK